MGEKKEERNAGGGWDAGDLGRGANWERRDDAVPIKRGRVRYFGGIDAVCNRLAVSGCRKIKVETFWGMFFWETRLSQAIPRRLKLC